ncbi:ABC transporter permease [Hymenobacter sp. RP-2-7]|uniref:ABC transporter permease n=1 Tax=Hymenobacter polaris TaxID=2682546 RepID=A0A7Y0AHH1_9BACT|nr:ABC transporter permease subunit [Hymenobacter polaris]NML67417.1 ABC transporter permease [Hymenobacter polaris]
MKAPRLHPSSGGAAYWALGWLALVAAVGLLAPWLPLPYSATAPDLANIAAPPTWHGPAPHYAGTDPLGRDVLAGLVAGSRQLLLLSLPATALATALGALSGGAAGYWGNHGLRLPGWAGLLGLAAAWWGLRPPLLVGLGVALPLAVLLVRYWRRGWAVPLDGLVLGASTLLGTVPRLLLVLAFAAGPPLGTGWLLVLLVLLAWPDMARLVRTQMRQVRTLPYVEAARAAGLPTGRVWWHHALPAASQPLRAFAPLTLAALIGLESTLAFLGIGYSEATVSWGQLLGELRQAPGAWWLVAGPGTLLLATLVALQSLARRSEV